MFFWGLALLWFFVFSIPCENILVFDSIGTVARLAGVLSFSIGTFLLICLDKFRSLLFEHYLLWAFYAWTILTSIWSMNSAESFIGIWTYSQLMLMVWLIWQYTPNRDNAIYLFSAYVIGGFVSIFSTVNNYFSNSQVAWQRYSATGFDPNELGLILSIGIPIAWYLSLVKKNTWFVLIMRIYVLGAWGAIMLTASRTAFICGSISSSFILLSSERLSPRIKIFFLLAIALIVPISVAYLIPETSIERLYTIGSSIKSGTINDRTTIWKHGLMVFSEHFLIGTGINTFPLAVKKFMGAEEVAHNLYLTIATEQGIIGILIFVAFLSFIVMRILETPSLERKFLLTVFFTWALGVFTLTWDGRKTTWIILTMLLTYAKAMGPQKGVQIRF